VRLHATFSQLWDEYDRAKAETEFRRGIAIPLAVLVVLIGLALSNRTAPFSFLGWLPFFVSVIVGCVLAVSLQYFSWQKEFESNKNVLSFVVTAAIKSPIFESLEKMIDDIDSRDRAAALEHKATITKIQAEAGRVPVDTD
jgi:phosphatidylserine synthase